MHEYQYCIVISSLGLLVCTHVVKKWTFLSKHTIVVRFPKFSFSFQYHLSVMYSYQVMIRVTGWLSLSSDVSYSYSFTEFRNTVLTNLIVNLSAFLYVFSGCFMHKKCDARFGLRIPQFPWLAVICIIVDACILVHNKN